MGTGLGEAYAIGSGTASRGHATEGAHADFAPATPLQIELLRRPRPDALCAATLAIFVDVLGAEAGNLALKLLASAKPSSA